MRTAHHVIITNGEIYFNKSRSAAADKKRAIRCLGCAYEGRAEWRIGWAMDGRVEIAAGDIGVRTDGSSSSRDQCLPVDMNQRYFVLHAISNSGVRYSKTIRMNPL